VAFLDDRLGSRKAPHPRHPFVVAAAIGLAVGVPLLEAFGFSLAVLVVTWVVAFLLIVQLGHLEYSGQAGGGIGLVYIAIILPGSAELALIAALVSLFYGGRLSSGDVWTISAFTLLTALLFAVSSWGTWHNRVRLGGLLALAGSALSAIFAMVTALAVSFSSVFPQPSYYDFFRLAGMLYFAASALGLVTAVCIAVVAVRHRT